ncbi:molybdopterin-guanine dinucleotide biosynthesis protein B [Oceanibaculum indicum]|uniref:Molybdopterin-guanine dinucleotide biosynthesis protein B n=1 Tax=Oceanibaculum indicum TaxID=526216 RepID=A0A420WRL0_9PROT|nr:molybdopterin-guanine dinucleotide biosynthesis protein B [Oceanibaculum indicum]RKQ73663.1 molybdopterin-guanine dinucleotide biosynthesis protein B [Oceanibaculum indicum]
MRIFGIAGWSGSGKTTLMTGLIPLIVRAGVTVSTVKHAHHAFDVDKPGKDSYRHREAGATEVMISSAARWALMHEHRGAPEPTLSDLIRNMTPVDLLLVEGFKHEGHEKLEVYRPSVGKPPLYREDSKVVAVASDAALADATVPVLPIDDLDAIARFILTHCGLAAR